MSEQQSDLVAHTPVQRQRTVSLAWIWLRKWLVPRGANLMLVAAYTMILAALIMFILAPPPVLPLWQFYGTIVTVSILLALNLVLPDLEEALGATTADRLHLLVSGGLILLANWLGQPESFSLLPFLLFMLVSQAVIMLRLAHALLFSLLVICGWLALTWTWNPSLQNLIGAALALMPGMVFAIIFSIVVARYGEQTARAEALLRELQVAHAELAAAREREHDLAVAQERIRLAREIHDGLGHHLTVLNVQLQAAAKLIERDPGRAATAIATCKEVAQSALAEARQSVAVMRRTPLDGRALDESLRALVADFDRHSSLTARFAQSGRPVALGPVASMTVYRAAQEGLTNAQKHAAAQQVTVTLEYTSALTRLVVQDDGAQPSAGSSGGGFGLAGLRERAEQLGGTFAAGPLPTGGFRLELALPLERNRDDSHPARG